MTRTVVVAGTHSGCGKTLVSLALMAALRRLGLTVQAFKAGPDFIDPGHHEAVTGRPSHNLDGWIMGRDTVRAIHARYAADADVAVVEGVMGLFDGASGTDDHGSTAQLARWLDAPVLLVADARSMARSAAAVVHGFCTFDPRLRVAGALLNRVGSENHRDLLEQAMAGLAEGDGVDLLGCLERAPHLEAPSRHLGLVTAQDLGEGHALDAAMAARMADWLCAAMNPGQLVNRLPGRVLEAPPPGEEAAPPSRARAARIGVARDRAFCFYYHENFRILEAAGAELVFFSPLADSALPEDLDGLYLGGGYPELHAQALAANESMRRAVHAHARAGKPLLAECGGFMYCMDALEQGEVLHPMCGVFAMRCAMDDRFRALGYREAVTTAPGPLGPECTVVRGHEFHYSHITAPDPDAEPAYKLRDRRDWLDRKEGWTRGNALGSYVHLHFASNPGAARAWVEFCARRGAPQETP